MIIFGIIYYIHYFRYNILYSLFLNIASDKFYFKFYVVKWWANRESLKRWLWTISNWWWPSSGYAAAPPSGVSNSYLWFRFRDHSAHSYLLKQCWQDDWPSFVGQIKEDLPQVHIYCPCGAGPCHVTPNSPISTSAHPQPGKLPHFPIPLYNKIIHYW